MMIEILQFSFEVTIDHMVVSIATDRIKHDNCYTNSHPSNPKHHDDIASISALGQV